MFKYSGSFNGNYFVVFFISKTFLKGSKPIIGRISY